jgi:hypothetical protein
MTAPSQLTIDYAAPRNILTSSDFDVIGADHVRTVPSEGVLAVISQEYLQETVIRPTVDESPKSPRI